MNSRLHVPYNKRCCGSSHGWLIFPEETLALVLYNPFSGATIHLPPVSRVPTEEEIREEGFFYHHEYEIQKVVLSADPSIAPESYEALAVFGDGMLSWFKSGCSSWIPVSPYQYVEEATYHNGKFYVASLALVARIDLCGGGLELVPISVTQRSIATRPFITGVQKVYLVGSPCGRLLLIDRYYEIRRIGISIDDSDNSAEYFENGSPEDPEEDSSPAGYSQIDHYVRENGAMDHDFTSGFKVYEVIEEMEAGQTQFMELNTLGDHILFVGHNDSELISTGDFPEYKANRIYYMDDCLHFPIAAPYHPLGAIDIGVFDLGTQRCEQLYVAGPGKGCMPPPIWFIPKANLENTLELSPR